MAAIAAMLLCACDDGSGGASSASGTGGPGASSGTGGAGASSSAGGAGGDTCAPYRDVAPQDAVSIHITNARTTPIYMDDTCSFPFAIELAGALHEGGSPEWLPTTCAKEMGSAPCCDCSAPEWKLEPGEDVTLSWHGIFYDLTQMPSECYGGFTTDRPCFAQSAAPAGPMKVVAHVFETFECLVTFCAPKDPLPAEQEFVYGTDSVVEITVE